MATTSITSTSEQDQAVNLRRLAYNASTGQSLTATQWFQQHVNGLLNEMVKTDKEVAHTDIKARWLAATDAQRTAAAAQLPAI